MGAELSLVSSEVEPDEKSVSLDSLTDKLKLGESSDTVTGLLGAGDDFNLELAVTMDWRRAERRPEGQLTLSGSYGGKGMALDLGLTMLVFDDTTYGRLDTAPAILPFIGSLEGTWFDLGAKEEDREVFRKVGAEKPEGDGSASEDDGGRTDLVAEVTAVLREGADNGAWTFSSLERGTDPLGRPSWRAEVMVSPELFRQAMLAAYAKRETLVPEVDRYVLLTDEAAEKASKPDPESVSDDIFEDVTVVLHFAEESYMPLAVSLETTATVESREGDTPEASQVDLKFGLTLDRVNEPVQMERPEASETLADAVLRATGVTPEQSMMRGQMDTIDDLREALRQYQKTNDSYPETLDALIGLRVEPNFPTHTDLATGAAKEVVLIPPDIYTGAPYGYRLTERGTYELTFEMSIPQYSSDQRRFEYAEGTNTATPNDVSLEGGDVGLREEDRDVYYADVSSYGYKIRCGDGSCNSPETPKSCRADCRTSMLDTDGDGLSNLREDSIGTNFLDPDTDGDGFGDKEEADGGYDPLTNAHTGEKYDNQQ